MLRQPERRPSPLPVVRTCCPTALHSSLRRRRRPDINTTCATVCAARREGPDRGRGASPACGRRLLRTPLVRLFSLCPLASLFSEPMVNGTLMKITSAVLTIGSLLAVIGCSGSSENETTEIVSSPLAGGGSSLQTCAAAVCPDGYQCEMRSSGGPGCYRKGAPHAPDQATCDGAACPSGYYCSARSGSATCYGNANSGGDAAPPPAVVQCSTSPDTCPAGFYCNDFLSQCQPGVPIPVCYAPPSGGCIFDYSPRWAKDYYRHGYAASKESCAFSACGRVANDCKVMRLPAAYGGGRGAVCVDSRP